MSETPLTKANSAIDGSMSTILLAASALATVCDSLLSGKEDEHGAVRVSKDGREAVTFMASHFCELVKEHVGLWESFDELRSAKSHGND